MCAVCRVEMVDKIGDTHDHAFINIIGNQTGKKQLIVVRMRGKQHEVRAVRTDLPNLHVFGQLADRVNGDFGNVGFRIGKGCL